MISKPAAAAGAWLSFGLLCGISSLAFGQQNPALISTGTRSGVRLYYPDSNDWWLDPSAGRLDIRVNGGAAPLATFLSGGNVGIGTPAPGFPLHVSVGAAGFIAGFINSNGNGGLRFKVNDASDSLGLGAPWRHAIWGSSSESLALVTNNSTAMVIDNSGKVGIGTAGPSMLLDVYGVNQRMRIGDGTNTLTVGQWDGVTNRIESANRGLRLTTYAGALDLGHSGNPELTVASGGNVGIGTTNPTAALTVNAAADSTPRAYLIGPGSGDASVAQIVRGNGSHKGSGLYISGANYTNGASPATQAFVELNAGPYAGANANFITAYDNSGTDFFIRGDGLGYFRGNVGIGTTIPSSKLTVQSPAANTYAAYFQGNGTNSQSFGLQIDAGTTSADFALRVRHVLNASEYFAVRGDGSVGIGTTNPTAKLHIGGTPGTDGIRFPDGTLQTGAAVTSGAQIQHVRVENGSLVSSNATFAINNTVPVITSGQQILSGSITPKTVGSKIRVRVTLSVGYSGTFALVTALFRNGATNAVQATMMAGTNSATLGSPSLAYEETTASLAALTYTVRCGSDGVNWTLGGYNGTQYLGGSQKSVLEIDEIAP